MKAPALLCFALRLRFLAAAGILFGALTAQGQVHYEPYYFGRLAGNFPGSDDGTGSEARFFDPEGVAVDAAGNVYVAEYVNSTIRKMTPAGVVTTFAGLAEHSGSVDGPRGAARFKGPTGVAVDTAGNFYVADFENNTIRKITPGGVVSTLAGLAGLYGSGSNDGVGSGARFYYPMGVAVDRAGYVYVADAYNNTIRKITPSGVVTTLAGLAGQYGAADGTGSAARFSSPRGVAVDSAGNVHVADTFNHVIRKITPGGVVSTVAGSAGNFGSDDGIGAAARFYYPRSVAVDSADNVYLADNFNHVIRKITPGGVVSTVAGSAGNPGSDDGTGAAARFYHPVAVAVNSAGIVYVGDGANNTIRKITPDRAVTTVAGVPVWEEPGTEDGTGEAARFKRPWGVAVDTARNVYVADAWNSTIRKITPAGVVTTLAGLAGFRGSNDGIGSAARFEVPQGVAADTGGNVYVADTMNSTIRKITPTGLVTTFAGFAGERGHVDGAGSAARFNQPQALAADTAGNVFVADTANNAIRKINSAGDVTTVAGGPGSWQFYTPSGVAVDTAGNLYVADTSHLEVRKVTPDGVVTTLAGSTSGGGTADGIGSAARFSEPKGIAVDVAGNVYVTDCSNHSVRKITPAAVVTTLAGLPTSNGNTRGVGSAARFYSPHGIAVDADGYLYLADFWNHTIRIGHAVAPAPQLSNISTRLAVGTGDNVLIGGFIITGSQTTKIILRAIGPSLTQLGVPGALADPSLEVYDSDGALLARNDNWRSPQVGGIVDNGNSYAIETSGFHPIREAESAIIATLSAGAYTTVVRGKNNTTGVALVEAYALDWGEDAKLANISTRGFVQTGDNVMIGGTIIRGSSSTTVVIRAIGPSLANAGVPNALQDPMLELRDNNGALMSFNDNWRDSQEAEIQARGLAPTNDLESAILATLSPGAYTAIVRGRNDMIGAALVEAYELGN